MRASLLTLVLLAAAAPASAGSVLDADAAASAAAREGGLRAIVEGHFAKDGVILAREKGLVRGPAAILAALAADPASAQAGRWTPVYYGVADSGEQAFTAGYGPAGETSYKYIAYWIREGEDWRVAVLKRSPLQTAAPTAAAPEDLLEPAPPCAATLAADRRHDTVAASEKAFSDESQTLGLGPAFAKFGAPRAVNMGAPTTVAWTHGPEAIGALVGEGLPPKFSPVTWKSDFTHEASSGDLGISVGYLDVKPDPKQPAAPPRRIPFLTVWTRASRDCAWHYVAE